MTHRPPKPHTRGRDRVRRRLRSVDLRNVPMFVVLLAVGSSLAYSLVISPHWLRGVMGLAASMLMAGCLRLVLPARQAGLLAVRSRFVDVVFYLGLGLTLVFLGITLATAGRS